MQAGVVDYCQVLHVPVRSQVGATLEHQAQPVGKGQGDHLGVTAGGAHNLAALILSDCGLPDLARSLCWRQFDTLQTVARPDDPTSAQLALQPLINLARLDMRNRYVQLRRGQRAGQS